jgi:hypothetical protein
MKEFMARIGTYKYKYTKDLGRLLRSQVLVHIDLHTYFALGTGRLSGVETPRTKSI